MLDKLSQVFFLILEDELESKSDNRLVAFEYTFLCYSYILYLYDFTDNHIFPCDEFSPQSNQFVLFATIFCTYNIVLFAIGGMLVYYT
jgi:hypothetical protein